MKYRLENPTKKSPSRSNSNEVNETEPTWFFLPKTISYEFFRFVPPSSKYFFPRRNTFWRGSSTEFARFESIRQFSFFLFIFPTGRGCARNRKEDEERLRMKHRHEDIITKAWCGWSAPMWMLNRKQCVRPTNVFTLITPSSLNAIEIREPSMACAKVYVSKSYRKLIMIPLNPQNKTKRERKRTTEAQGQVRITCSHLSMFPFCCVCVSDDNENVREYWRFPAAATFHGVCETQEFLPHSFTHNRTHTKTVDNPCTMNTMRKDVDSCRASGRRRRWATNTNIFSVLHEP